MAEQTESSSSSPMPNIMSIGNGGGGGGGGGARRMESALLQTLSDYQLRAEVETCLNSMLQDVETAFHLQQKLELQSSKQQVDHLTKQQKATVLDADAERLMRDAQRLELADQLVLELMTLSEQLEGLVDWKKKHQHKVETYDELVAQLAQKDEELQAANRVSYGGGPKPRQPVEPAAESEKETSEEAIDAEKTEAAATAAVAAATTSKSDPIDIDEALLEVDEEKKPAAQELRQTEETVVDIPGTGDAATETVEDSKPKAEETTTAETPAAAVTLDEEEADDEVPGLVEIDVEILMNIFGFLDPMDILNTAQINVEMYTRVDNIFGISEDGHSRPEPQPAKPPAAPQPAVASQPAAAPAPSKPTPKPQQPVDTKPPAPAITPPVDMGPLGKGLFSMLQPRAAGRGKQPGKSQPFNASVAVSMAEKLSDSELAAIISITDKSSKLEKEVNMLRNEKEALTAKLDSTEAVKQFLIGKVRDVEQKLSMSKEEEVKVTQQIASDQEVIAFLDSQVQELERSSMEVTGQRDSLKSELESLKVSSSKRITMLNDMLKYEREKLKDAEGEWKSTKKVLVKEVKSCRAQILALQAERDGYKEQNEMLKRAITSTGKNAGGASSPSR